MVVECTRHHSRTEGSSWVDGAPINGNHDQVRHEYKLQAFEILGCLALKQHRVFEPILSSAACTANLEHRYGLNFWLAFK